MKNFFNYHFQPYHLVTLSPWPILTSINLMFLAMSVIKMFNTKNFFLFFNLLMTILCAYQWWRDVIRESTYQGFHTYKVIKGIKLGMILFIISEVFFFISFFWSYFHMILSPSIEIGNFWPPKSFNNFLLNPYELPLLNSIILVSSGMFLSLSHYYMILKNNKSIFWMYLTIIFGIIFTYIQIKEYLNMNFTIFNSVYATSFFMMTGFHGLHVLIGTIFLMTIMFRMIFNQMSNIHHFGFEASAWYWHFVDVVWLFLFMFVYWWPY